MSAKELSILKQYLDSNLQKGFIRPSKSLSLLPTFFVPNKQDPGTTNPNSEIPLRIVHDYKFLISDLLGRLHTFLPSKIFAMHAISLGSKRAMNFLTAFITRYSKFVYTVVPFGLNAVFSRFMKQIFSDVIDTFVVL